MATVFPRHLRRPPLVGLAALSLLLGLLIVPTQAGARGATASRSHDAHSRGSLLHAGVGDQRALTHRSSCPQGATISRVRRRISLRRELSPRRRRRAFRRLERRARRCAAESAAPPAPLYWGAWIGDQLTGTEAPWDMNAVSSFEGMVGKSMSLVQFSSPFADCSSSPCSFYDFPAEEMEAIRQHNSIPFFSWASQATPASVEEPEFQLSDVIAGTYDSYIRSFAEEAHEWGHPFFLRFNWEMNGNWFAWAEGVNGNQPGEYVAAWRHVHDIFAEVGATNATWVWCPYVDPRGKLPSLASLYPGDEYVDWTGLDGYDWGPHHAEGWRSFDELYRSTYEYITNELAPSKPMAIGEMGATESGGSKSAWITEALGAVPTEYPKIRALLWFEKYDDGMDWPVESSSASQAAFASGIQNPAYAGNATDEGSGPVQPPA